METDDGDVVVVGDPHRIERIDGTSEARWQAMLAGVEAARVWRNWRFRAGPSGAGVKLAAALDRLAAVERGEAD